jgi:rare lipoprotein A
LIILSVILLPAALFGRDPKLPGDSVVPKGKHRTVAVKALAATKGPIKIQYGTASFYADKFEGRKTFTDEIFTQDSLTGASNTLPMHVWVKVTNLRNNKTVIVRINDKMHPRNKRIIDLSRAAAVKLGYAGRGLTRVRIDVIGRKKPPDAVDETADRRQGQD